MHEQNRKKLYLLCFGIDKNDDRLPNVICSNCQKIVHEYGNGIFSRKIEIFDYFKRNTRSSQNKTCSCTICLSQLSFNFNSNNGVPKIKKRNSSGRPKTGNSDFKVSKKSTSFVYRNVSEKPSPMIVCSFCLSTLARGRLYSCTRAMRKVKNEVCEGLKEYLVLLDIIDYEYIENIKNTSELPYLNEFFVDSKKFEIHITFNELHKHIVYGESKTFKLVNLFYE
ncbi:hypothetical protein A3Q56_07000 [Intoshia linei]|uniref:Uncharacterized protein n=1 Tax=Intoshia linei TaxID=1819745 RepID=A0A177AVP5_9BILA|nr:hypothetical protein A3Q56_07000 [Intoshia linei]